MHDGSLVVTKAAVVQRTALVVENEICHHATTAVIVSHAIDILPRSPPDATALRRLASRGFPAGLVDIISTASELCAVRYWIVDNSGSMQTQDGNVFLPTST